MSYVEEEERTRREATWSQTIASSKRRDRDSATSAELSDVSTSAIVGPSALIDKPGKPQPAKLSEQLDPIEFVLNYAEKNPKLAIGLAATRRPEIVTEPRLNGCQVRVTRKVTFVLQFESRTGKYEAPTDRLLIRDGIGDSFAVLTSTPELVVGQGRSESEAMAAAVWQVEERVDTAFLRAKFGQPAPADAPEVVKWNRWREEHARFLGKSNVVFNSFYGQLVERGAASLLLRWIGSDDDDTIDVAGVPGSHLLANTQVGDWFSSRVIQRMDTGELASILDVVPGRPPRTEPLSEAERMALKAKFVDLKAED